MKTLAYCYSDPLLESLPDPVVWEGFEVDRFYQDLGQRQQLGQLLSDCQNDPPNCLLIRRLEELGDTLDQICDRLNLLESLGIEVVTKEQDYRSSLINSGNFGEFRTNLAKNLQKIQNIQRSNRLKQGHARNRLKTLPPPGRAPYGYRRGKDRYLLDRSTAPVVKEFFERFLLFGSVRGAVRYLEKRYGKKISVSTGRRWLTNPVYRGDLAYNCQDIIPDTHVPLLERSEAAQIDRLLRRNCQMSSRTASAPRSLAGLVACAECQSPMTVTRVTRPNQTTEYLYLRPMRCLRSPKCKAMSYQAVLEATIARICEDLPATVAQLNLPNLDGIKQRLRSTLQTKQSHLEQVSTLQTQGILDEETAQLRRYKLKVEIAQIQAQFDQLPPGDLTIIAQAVSIPEFWRDLSESERRFYFREFIRQIQTQPTGGKSWELRLIFIF